MEDTTIKELAAIGCITILEAIALAVGMNGLLLISALAALAGIAGYELKAMRG